LGEIDVVEAFGRQRGQFCRKADHWFAGEMEIAGGIGQAAHLFGRRFYHAFLAIADIDAPQAGKGVDHAPAVYIGQPHAVPAGQHACAMLLMAPERGDWVDQVIAVKVDQRAIGQGFGHVANLC
jgi:hypothetical protein